MVLGDSAGGAGVGKVTSEGCSDPEVMCESCAIIHAYGGMHTTIGSGYRTESLLLLLTCGGPRVVLAV